MSSKLIVEICKVDDVIKHPNADKLSIIVIKGWNCIVSLDQYKKGDLVVYCPPDSVIPDNLIEKYNLEFLKKDGKVGTIKLRKYISQGLILDVPNNIKEPKEGMDVANIMGITKWIPPQSKNSINNNQETLYKTYKKWRNGGISFSRFIKKSFHLIKDGIFKRKKKLNPLFDKYTDINNIKHYNTLFKDGEEVVIYEKLHGSNARASYLPKKKSIFNFGDKYEF
ncbi:MAG: hypothetical protein M0R03_16315, partial [Novosphingobium sp.]|nr:hypothetical protein [Novosphingobium sp.]